MPEAGTGICRPKVAIACHKMTNIISRPRHIMLFEVTDPPAGAGSIRQAYRLICRH